MKKQVMLFIIFISMSHAVYSQVKLTRDKLIADADTLYAGIDEIHPDMFASYPKEKWIEEFDMAKSCLKDSMTLYDFYRLMAPLVTKLGDGHTHVNIPDDELEKNKVKAFPFTVNIDKSTRNVYIEDSFSSLTIPRGAQVLTINGRDVKEVVENLLEYESGEKDFFRLDMLSKQFHQIYYLFYRDSVFDIKYEFENSQYTKQVDGIDISLIKRPEIFSIDDKSYSISTINNTAKTVLLSLNRCDIDALESLRYSLDSTFAMMKEENIDHFIIDIRNNSGGDSRIADELFQFISPEPFTQCDRMYVKISNRIRQSFGFLRDEELGVKTISFPLVELDKRKNTYKGKTYLLISNYTFSAAADLAYAFKHYNMGTVIGEETGGVGVSFGDIIGLDLLNTGLSCSVSWKKFYNVGASDDNIHGAIPDFLVPASDVFEYTLKMIND